MKIQSRIALILTVGFMVSCRSFDIFAEIDNPFDPESANYLPPETQIVSGPTMDGTIHESQATLQWRHAKSQYWPNDSSGYQIAAAVEFAYRINSGNWSEYKSGRELLLDSLSYWSFDTSTGIHTFELTDLEDREYLITVRCKYPTGIIESSGKFRRFTVDALQGPGLILSPGFTNVEIGESLVLSVVGIDVVDLMGIHAIVEYDPMDFVLLDMFFRSDTSTFLMQTMADSLEDFTFVDHDSSGGTIDVNIAIAAGASNGVNGSGEIIL